MIKRRKEALPQFVQESVFVLADFAESLGWPGELVMQPNQFLSRLDEFMRSQVVGDNDRPWITVRIAYSIGDWLIHNFGGCWHVNENTRSRFFGRYVVGQFTAMPDSEYCVDPFLIAEDYLQQSAGRNLQLLVDQVAQTLTNQS